MNKKGLILVADDDLDVLDTTVSLIELFGYDVIQAKNGIEAISQYEKSRPGLVFLDVKMPKIDGYKAFFELKKNFPDAKIILMTAHADYSKWNEAKKHDALALMEKPYSAEFLKNIVEKYYPKS